MADTKGIHATLGEGGQTPKPISFMDMARQPSDSEETGSSVGASTQGSDTETPNEPNLKSDLADEDVQMAIAALEIMKSGGVSVSPSASVSRSSSTSSAPPYTPRGTNELIDVKREAPSPIPEVPLPALEAQDARISPMLQVDNQTQASPRSAWQTVLVEAGGIGAAVSEESLKSLRYCLDWLSYSVQHLSSLITALHGFIDSLARESVENALQFLSQIKHDVIETIRKVVDVISQYAGGALPEPAKRYVRESIMSLPSRWVQFTRTHPPHTSQTQLEDSAAKILSFASESREMFKGLYSIFGDSLGRAEAWIERLRYVGLDRSKYIHASVEYPPPMVHSDSSTAVTSAFQSSSAPPVLRGPHTSSPEPIGETRSYLDTTASAPPLSDSPLKKRKKHVKTEF